MVEAFNTMAAELASSRRRLERAAIDLERKHQEVEAAAATSRRSSSASPPASSRSIRPGASARVNSAAIRLLELDAGVDGRPAVDVFGRPISQPVNAVLDQAARARTESPSPRKSPSSATGASCTRRGGDPAAGADGGYEGTVLVLDDVTPLIRAQKVAAWREVARRLAHEIKNPLTPIQLSAERMRRKLGDARRRRCRRWCRSAPTTIIGEVESLKDLVDEFSQFARMPAPRAVPTDLHAAADRRAGALRRAVHRRRRSSGGSTRRLPTVRARPRADASASSSTWSTTPSRRWIAAARSSSRPRSTMPNSLVRIVVADDGPGHSRPASARSCSCRTTRPRAAAAASAWPSSGASSPSTAAPSKSPDNVPRGTPVHDRAAAAESGTR